MPSCSEEPVRLMTLGLLRRSTNPLGLGFGALTVVEIIPLEVVDNAREAIAWARYEPSAAAVARP